MDEPTHISDTRHGRVLAELASLGLTLARDLHARALAAETSEEAAKLATAFHRISRGVRQSLALEARLGREQETHDAQLAPVREAQRLARVSRRHSQVLKAVREAIWTESDDMEIAGHLVDDLRERLDFEALEPEFLAEPLERQVARLRVQFGLPAEPPAPDGAPEADDAPDDESDPDDEADDAEFEDDPEVDALEASPDSWGARIGGLAPPSADTG